MRTVGSRELKNRLGRYLSLVGKGETILVTDRGKPVARLLPAGTNEEAKHGLEDLLNQLEAEGHLRRAKGKFKAFKPIRARGKSASRMVLEGRD
jgi:prevent-host-death family protein